MHKIKIVSTFSGLTLCLEKSQDRSMAKGAPGVAFLYTRPRKWSRLSGYEFFNLKLKWYFVLIFSFIAVMAQEVLHVRDRDLQSTLGLDHGQRRTRRWNLLQVLLFRKVRNQRIRLWERGLDASSPLGKSILKFSDWIYKLQLFDDLISQDGSLCRSQQDSEMNNVNKMRSETAFILP